MNNTQKRDIQYSFVDSVANPLYTQIIDDSWRKEKFHNLDIILPAKIIQENLNTDQNENDPFSGGAIGKEVSAGRSNVPIADTKKWDDLSMNELIGKYTESEQQVPKLGFDSSSISMDLENNFRKFR